MVTLPAATAWVAPVEVMKVTVSAVAVTDILSSPTVTAKEVPWALASPLGVRTA